jgi:hypothetical protein
LNFDFIRQTRSKFFVWLRWCIQNLNSSLTFREIQVTILESCMHCMQTFFYFFCFVYISNVIIFMVLRAAFFILATSIWVERRLKIIFSFSNQLYCFFCKFQWLLCQYFLSLIWNVCCKKKFNKTGWKFRQFLYNILKKPILDEIFVCCLDHGVFNSK